MAAWFQASEFLQNERDRLGRMRQLGVLSSLHPLLRHTRLEHHEGIEFLVDQVSSRLPNSAFRTKPKNRLLAASIHGIGHLPLGPDLEAVVSVLAASGRIAVDDLVERFRRVNKLAGEAGASRLKNPLKENPLHLSRWLSASKIVEQQGEIQDAVRGVDLAVVVRLLVDTRWVESRFLNTLDMYEYLLRDGSYSGKLAFTVNLAAFLDGLSYREGAPQLPYFDVLSGLLKEQTAHLYEAEDSRCMRALFRSHAMEVLLSGELGIDDLMKLDDEEFIGFLRDNTGWYPEEEARGVRDQSTRVVLNLQGADARRHWSAASSWRTYASPHSSRNTSVDASKCTVFASVAEPRTGFGDDPSSPQVSVVMRGKTSARQLLTAASRCEDLIRGSADEGLLRMFTPTCTSNPGKYRTLYSAAFQSYFDTPKQGILDVMRQMMGRDDELSELVSLLDALSRFIPPDADVQPLERVKAELERDTIQRFHTLPASFRDHILGRLQADKSQREVALELVTWLRRQILPGAPGIDTPASRVWAFPEVAFQIPHEVTADLVCIYLYKTRMPIVDLVQCSIDTSSKKKFGDTSKIEQIRHYILDKSPVAGTVRVRCFFNDEELDV